MTIKYLDKSFTGFQEYIDSGPKAGLLVPGSTPLYAHPIDAEILQTLNATPVRAVIEKAMDALVSFQFGHKLTSGVMINQNSFPELFKALSHCAKTLGIPMPHTVIEQGSELFNAFTAGTDEYAFISISPGLCNFYSNRELSFVIGHECGHIAARHMVYHTLVEVLTGTITPHLGAIGTLLSSTAGIPLMAWSRRSEITADRAGLLCCGDLAIAERALLRLVTGIVDAEGVDVNEYLQRSENVRDFHGIAAFLGELGASHPMIPKRIAALRLFADSELYYSVSGKPRPKGKILLSQEELNRQVNRIVQP